MEEIEIRGSTDKSGFGRLMKFLDKNGQLIDHYHRISVDLSLGFDEKSRNWNNSSGADLRVKKSGDSEKVSLKLGNFSDQKRREIEVNLKSGEFCKMIELLIALGFSKGMIYAWESWEFNCRDYEIKLSRLSLDYYRWEIEGKDGNEDLIGMAEILKVVPQSEDEYRRSIKWENQNIHSLFSLEKLKELLAKAE